MDQLQDQATADEFLSCVGGLLSKVDTFLDTMQPNDASHAVDMKRKELIESLQFFKSYFLENRFPEQVARSEPTNADSNNNNNAAITSTDDQNTTPSQLVKSTCLCVDFESIRFVPKILDISAGRRLHFSSQLQCRMVANGKFAVRTADLLIMECQGWLSVDEQHKFYARISDCLFCLFETDETETALMSLVLDDSHTQEIVSTNDKNAFTITLQQEEALYFCAESTDKRTDWVRWLNVGAQLPFADLVSRLDRHSLADDCTQTETPAVMKDKATCMAQPAGKSRPTSDVTDSCVQITNQVQMRENAPMLMRQAKANHRTQSIIDDNVKMRYKMEENPCLRSAASYDWSLDQGTSRHFPSIVELQNNIRVRKAVSFSEGLSAPVQTMPAESKQPGYLLAAEKRALYSQKSASLDSRNSTTRVSRFVQRASSFFTGKSQSFTLPARNKRQPTTTSAVRHSLQGDRQETVGGDAILFARSSGISSVDLAGFCEIQGYLLFKKPLKWSSYYCCVYNGTFSCFKDQTTSLPEVQCHLRDCQVRPAKGKRPFVFKMITSSKSAYFAAVSETDLHSWYNVFNNYIKSALALSRHRGGGYAMWQWTGDGYIDPQILTNSIANAYHMSIDDEQHETFCRSDSDCSHLEKTSADGASNHSVESDGFVRPPSCLPHESERAAVGTSSAAPASPAMRSVSESEYRRYRYSRVVRGDNCLSQFYCKSVDDIPSFSSSLSSSGEDEACGDDPISKSKKSREDRRKDLLDKMLKEKLKIEHALEQQKRRDDEEKETERLVNRTKLKQRRVSTQLKYDFLEKQLQEKREDKSRYGVFQRGNKVEKPGRHTPAAVVDTSTHPNQHIRKQMDELKRKLDCLDKGLSETQTYHVMKSLPAPVQRVGFPQDVPVDSLSQHKLRGLESIIETLEAPKHQPSLSQELSNENNNCKRCSVISEKSISPTEIRPETLVVISEFETMIHELVSRRPSINYEQQ